MSKQLTEILLRGPNAERESSRENSLMAPSSIPSSNSQHTNSIAAIWSFGFNAVRGLYCKGHTSANMEGPYSDGGVPGQVALEASVASTNSLTDAQKFFRVSASLAP